LERFFSGRRIKPHSGRKFKFNSKLAAKVPEEMDALLSRIPSASDATVLGFALIVERKGAPPYDVLTVAAMSCGLGADATPEEAQRALDSVLDFRADYGNVTVVTDIGLKPEDGTTVDTDDRQMALALLYGIPDAPSRCWTCERAPSCAPHEFARTITFVLSARKKAKDGTAPSDVVAWICAQRADARVADGCVLIGDTRVCVFQLAASYEAPETKLSPDELLDAGAIAALRERNKLLYEHLDAIDAMRVLVCGPLDVALAKYIVDRGLSGYSISCGSGVNGGDSTPLKQQYSNCGGLVLKSARGVVDFEASLTRKLQIPLRLLEIESTEGLVAVAQNSYKTGASPMLPPPLDASEDALRVAALVLRISESNRESTVGQGWTAPETVGGTECVRYAANFALALVANQMLANGTPLEGLEGIVAESLETALAASRSPVRASALVPRALHQKLPPRLAQIAAANLPEPRVETLGDLFLAVLVGMEARLAVVTRIAAQHGLAGIRINAPAPSLERGGLRIERPIS
jgi:hypothetical protein